MSNNELLPCPFCGGQPSSYEHIFRGLVVTCWGEDCPVRAKTVEASQWNRRTPAANFREIREEDYVDIPSVFDDVSTAAPVMGDKSPGVSDQGGVVEKPEGDERAVYHVPLSLFRRIWNTVDYYQNICSYRGERIGGVLAGCPRTPDPTPEQMTHEARSLMAALEEFVRPTL